MRFSLLNGFIRQVFLALIDLWFHLFSRKEDNNQKYQEPSCGITITVNPPLGGFKRIWRVSSLKLIFLFRAKFNHRASFFYDAVRLQDFETVKFLIREGDVLDRRFGLSGETLLHVAAKEGSLDIVQLLIDAGANCQARDNLGETPAMLAAREGYDLVLCALLLSKEATIDEFNNANQNLLSIASSQGNLRAVKVILKKGANVNYSDRLGRTALSKAIKESANSVVRLLLQAQASVNKINFSGNSLVHMAVKVKNAQGLEILLEREWGTNFEVHNNNGKTPFHIALDIGHLGTVIPLLQANCDVNMIDMCNRTALEIAFLSGNYHLAKTLISFGADVFQVNVNQALMKKITRNTVERKIFSLIQEYKRIYRVFMHNMEQPHNYQMPLDSELLTSGEDFLVNALVNLGQKPLTHLGASGFKKVCRYINECYIEASERYKKDLSFYLKIYGICKNEENFLVQFDYDVKILIFSHLGVPSPFETFKACQFIEKKNPQTPIKMQRIKQLSALSVRCAF